MGTHFGPFFWGGVRILEDEPTCEADSRVGGIVGCARVESENQIRPLKWILVEAFLGLTTNASWKLFSQERIAVNM